MLRALERASATNLQTKPAPPSSHLSVFLQAMSPAPAGEFPSAPAVCFLGHRTRRLHFSLKWQSLQKVQPNIPSLKMELTHQQQKIILPSNRGFY